MVDQLTVEENLTLGMEDTTFGLRRTDKINKMVSVMNSIEPSIKPRQLVSSLSVAQADRGDCEGSCRRVGHHHHG